MIVIVEGIARVGKTTLCNKLEKELGLCVYKHNNSNFDYSKMDNENETDKMLQLIDLIKIENNFDIVFDRFYLSDYVYGIIERKYNKKNAKRNAKKIEKELKKVGAILVYVEPTNIEESSRQHGKSLAKYESKFKKMYKKSKLSRLKVNYNSLDDAVEFLASMKHCKEESKI